MLFGGSPHSLPQRWRGDVVGPFLALLADIVGLSFLGPRLICFSRCGSLSGLRRHVADKCVYCSQRREFYLCVCASNVCLNCLNTWPAEAISSRTWAGCLKVQDSHFTFKKRRSKTYCSFTVAVEQYRQESSAVLTRRTFCYRTSATVLIRAEETSRVLV